MESVVEQEDEQEKEEPRAFILLAALKLFAQKGFFNTSLPEIASAAGLESPNALHQHFKTKQAIAAALYATILDSLSISVDDIKRKNAKASEQLRGIIDLFFKLTEEAPDVIRLLFMVNMNEILPDEKPIIESPAFLKIRKIFGAGVKAGEMRNIDPLLLYSYFFGIINQVLILMVSGALNKDPEFYHSQVWLAAWNAIAKIKNQ